LGEGKLGHFPSPTPLFFFQALPPSPISLADHPLEWAGRGREQPFSLPALALTPAIKSHMRSVSGGLFGGVLCLRQGLFILSLFVEVYIG
jgi:hypothetical protein